jgi:hypothetical protein
LFGFSHPLPLHLFGFGFSLFGFSHPLPLSLFGFSRFLPSPFPSHSSFPVLLPLSPDYFYWGLKKKRARVNSFLDMVD